jgi:hypothetical protein
MMMRSEVGMGTGGGGGGGGGGGTQFSDIFPPNNNGGGGNYSSMMTNNNNHSQMSGGNGNFSRMGSLDGPSMMYGMTGMGSMQYCMPIDAPQGKKTSSSNKMTMNSSQTQV